MWNPLPLRCPDCGAEFMLWWEYARHVRSQRNEKGGG